VNIFELVFSSLRYFGHLSEIAEKRICRFFVSEIFMTGKGIMTELT